MAKNGIPKTAITEKTLRKHIRGAAKSHSSVSAWAVENGLTAQQVTAFLRKTQGAGLKLPELLGYRPQLIFIPLNEDLICTLPPPRVKATKRPTKKVDHSLEPVVKKGNKPKDDRKDTKKRLKKRKK